MEKLLLIKGAPEHIKSFVEDLNGLWKDKDDAKLRNPDISVEITMSNSIDRTIAQFLVFELMEALKDDKKGKQFIDEFTLEYNLGELVTPEKMLKIIIHFHEVIFNMLVEIDKWTVVEEI